MTEPAGTTVHPALPRPMHTHLVLLRLTIKPEPINLFIYAKTLEIYADLQRRAQDQN